MSEAELAELAGLELRWQLNYTFNHKSIVKPSSLKQIGSPIENRKLFALLTFQTS
jgi:hypothetical protein